ncbi:MAG: hypothetical protein HC902_03380 [Calothrix sp. SM1_5_4]|nr:hypothetical protein [Calothrix sp. SM1_5_4]
MLRRAAAAGDPRSRCASSGSRAATSSCASGFLLDGLSLWFGAVVALITFLVQVYSLGLHGGGPGEPSDPDTKTVFH